MSQIVPFNFEGLDVRVTDQGGSPWFVAADVCQALSLSNPSVAVKALDEDERAKLNLGRQGEATIISESGVFALILRCRDAMKAGTVPHRLRKWVTGEVLPSIRKTGGYGAPAPAPDLTDPAALRTLLLAHAEREMELQAQVQTLAPKAEALDRIATAHGSMCITDAAKTLQVAPNVLFAHLRAGGWIYRRMGGGDAAYQDKLNAGLLEHKLTALPGSDRVVTRVRVTPKGLTRLSGEVRGPGTLPLGLPVPEVRP